MLNTVLVCFLFVLYVEAANVGEACTKEGASGICTEIKKCSAALRDIRELKQPQICSFSGVDSIVCCLDGIQPDVTPLTTNRTVRATKPDPGSPLDSGACGPLDTKNTAAKTGQKAWDKCIEYQERLVFPCQKNINAPERDNFCGHEVDELIDRAPSKNEFPHMVVLGYGNSSESLQWLCSGALISERFILTAAHCSASREYGPVTYALVAAYKLSELDSSRLYKVKRVIRHPEHKTPSRYNDIALLETETEMQLDRWAVPACLDTDTNNPETKVIVTGWGPDVYRGPRNDILQKGTLTKFSTPECAEKFPISRHMRNGIDEKTQICYGDKTSSDTCQDQHGGLLQVNSKQIRCMYKVTGVTSFGRACGLPGEPAVYTRVSAFVPWIESVVWP